MSGGSLQLGYSLSSAPENPIWLDLPVSKKWTTFMTNISELNDKIVIIFIHVSLPFDFSTKISIGEICFSNNKRNTPVSINPLIKTTYKTSSTGVINYVLQWKPVDCTYYNIFENNQLIGHYYQGKNVREKVKNVPILFSTVSTEPQGSFSVVPVNENGPSYLVSTKYSGYSKIALIFTILILVSFILLILFWNKLSKTTKNILLIVILAISLLILLVLWAVRNSNVIYKPLAKIEMWQDCKPHAFNACFDDSRVKCWRWLISMWKKKNWPIKFSFFYNTLWITRDYYVLREWIEMGHEICGHMHQHVCPCATQTYDFATKQWVPFTDQDLANNLIVCANLIRKLYGETDRELLVAWPHGSFPLINDKIPCGADQAGQDCGSPNPHDGVPRALAIKALEDYNTWPNPSIVPPDSNFGGIQKWNTSSWPYNIDPKWGWPYQIEVDPPDVKDPTTICDGYFKDMNSALSLPYGAVIIAGHTFNPTDADGKDVPCSADQASQMSDGPYDGSWCKDKNDCANTFVCPKEIRDITLGCWVNPPGTPIPLYNSDGSLIDPIFPPDKKYELQLPTNPECNQCCDACWDPVPGSCIIKLFDEVTRQKDIYWFATFTEIIQYIYNRQNSLLTFSRMNGKSFEYNLDCAKMYKCDLTLSFGNEKFSAKVDEKLVNVSYDSMTDKYFIKFIPKSNFKHLIKIDF